MRISLFTWSIYGKQDNDTLAYDHFHSGQWIENKGQISYDKESPLLPLNLRRRLSNLGKMAMEELFCVTNALNNEQIPWIVSCRHGDSSRMINLLTDLEKNEALSPMDFSLSVHNAIIGLYSISTKNKLLHTVLSGGEESFEMGLLEAYALQKSSRKSVGYLYYHLPLPTFYGEKIQNKDDNLGYCVSIILTSETTETPISPAIHLEFAPQIPPQNSEKENSEPKRNTAQHLINYITDTNKQTLNIPIPGGAFLLEKNTPYHF